MPKDLVSVTTRQHFREHMVDSYVLRRIRDAFAVGEVRGDSDYSPPVSGERRTLVEQYYHTLDLTIPGDAQKLLKVYEVILDELDHQMRFGDTYAQSGAAAQMDKLLATLRRDGIERVEGRLVMLGPANSQPQRESTPSTSSMREPADVAHIRLAIDLAKKCRSEPGKISPMVGAVVIRDGRLLSSAYRGEVEPGQHAEYIALEEKLGPESIVAGATVYTTLEPCTTRNHPKIPCAERLVERRVKRVVIGMLDPDERILGRGLRLLREHGIAVSLFPPEEAAEVEDLNRRFSASKKNTPGSAGGRHAVPAASTRGSGPTSEDWTSLTDYEKRVLLYLIDKDEPHEVAGELREVAGGARNWNLAEQRLIELDFIRFTQLWGDVRPDDGYELTERGKAVVRHA